MVVSALLSHVWCLKPCLCKTGRSFRRANFPQGNFKQDRSFRRANFKPGGHHAVTIQRTMTTCVLCRDNFPERETEFFIDNLWVRIHVIIQMIVVDGPCAMAD